MRHRKWIIGALILILGLAGIAVAQQYPMEPVGGQQQPPAQPASTVQLDASFTAANEWLSKKNLSLTGSAAGRDDNAAFGQEVILFYGEAYGNPSHTNIAQRGGMAKRAAVVVAQRSLAEYMNGFAIVGDTLVRDGVAQYDVIRSAVVGFIKGVQVVFQDYSPEKDTAIAIIKVGMHGPDGFATSVYKKMFKTERKMDPQFVKAIHEVDGKPAPSFKAAVVPTESYDGLIIDATEQNFRPALINRVFTPKGELLYDPSKISQKVLVEQGCGEYTNSVDKAKAALEKRGVKNPLVVKAVGTISPSDVQVSDDDAVNIFSANQKRSFFASAKVAFVLK